MLLNIDNTTISAGSTQSHKYEYFVLNEMIDINTEYVLSVDKVEITNYSTSVKGVQTYFANEYIAESSKVAPQLLKVQNTPQKFKFSINRFNTTRLIVYAGEDGRTAGNTVKLTGVKLYRADEEPPQTPSTGEGKKDETGGAEMSGEIFIADKKTLDSVKQDTEYLKTQSGSDYVDTTFLKLNGFKGLRTSTNNLEKLFEENGDTVTVVEVAGKGYIQNLSFNNASTQYSENCNVEVNMTIDDINYKFAAYEKEDFTIEVKSYIGFTSKSLASPYKSLDSTNIYEILSTYNDIRDKGFKFNKNCKIQLKKLGRVSSYIHFYLYGGVTIG